MKYGITQNLTADFTYNTDFAQVEADEQQVNLTRFSLFFPEKREFFLENQGTVRVRRRRHTAADGAATRRSCSTAGASGSNEGRVGADRGRRAPDRPRRPLQPRAAEHPDRTRSRCRASPATNFSVVRVKRDILRRSSVGVIVTGRSVGAERRRLEPGLRRRRHVRLLRQPDHQHLLGADAHRRAVGRRHELSGAARLRRRSVRRAARAPRRRRQLQSGSRLRAARRHAPQLRPVPVQPAAACRSSRSASSRGPASMAYIENGAGRLETRELAAEFAIEFQNSDRFTARLRRHLRVPAAAVPHRAGRHASRRAATTSPTRASAFTFGQQRRLSGNVSVEHGTFYSGHKTTVGVSRGRVNFTPQLSRRADVLGQLGRSRRGLVHDAPGRLARRPTR